MRGAAARSGVASSIAYDDRDRMLREAANKQAEEAIWKFSPRKLLTADEYAAKHRIAPEDMDRLVNPEGELCFRIRSPRGFSIGYKMKRAVVAMTGVEMSPAEFRLIEFEGTGTSEMYGEFITADPDQIERLRRPDCVMRGVVEWSQIYNEHLTREGEEAAEKLKDPVFLRGMFAGLRKLGLNPDETFASVLKPKRAPITPLDPPPVPPAS